MPRNHHHKTYDVMLFRRCMQHIVNINARRQLEGIGERIAMQAGGAVWPPLSEEFDRSSR